MKNSLIAFGLIASLSSLLACTKDMNADDYKNKQYADDLGKLQAAAGVYRGLLISDQDHSVLGAVQLSLTPRMGSHTNADGSKSSATAVMGTNVQFLGSTTMSVSAQDGTYDPVSGDFEADLPIAPQVSSTSGTTSGPSTGGSGTSTTTTTPTAPAEPVVIRGNVQGGGFTGYIQDDKYPSYRTTFTLQRDGASLQKLIAQSPPKPALLFTQKSYNGTTKFSNGVSKPVSLVLLKPPATTPEQNFLNLLLPIKNVLLTFNYGNAANILYANASLDEQNQLITGTNTVIRNNQSLQLAATCTFDSGLTEIKCTHSSSNDSQQNVAVTDVLSVNGQSTTPPPDNSKTRDPIIRVYQGQAELAPKQWTNFELTVVYAALSRLDEIYELFFPLGEKIVQVSFLFPETQVGASFSMVTWDINNQTLQGNQQLIQVNRTINLQISCRNFDFAEDKYNFTCTYLSDLQNKYINFRFKKP